MVLKVKGGCKGVSDKSRCMSAPDAMQMEGYPIIIPLYPHSNSPLPPLHLHTSTVVLFEMNSI